MTFQEHSLEISMKAPSAQLWTLWHVTHTVMKVMSTKKSLLLCWIKKCHKHLFSALGNTSVHIGGASNYVSRCLSLNKCKLKWSPVMDEDFSRWNNRGGLVSLGHCHAWEGSVWWTLLIHLLSWFTALHALPPQLTCIGSVYLPSWCDAAVECRNVNNMVVEILVTELNVCLLFKDILFAALFRALKHLLTFICHVIQGHTHTCANRCTHTHTDTIHTRGGS